MPRRTPGARYVVWGDPDAPAPSHDEHIEAIRALCCSSSVYTHSRLAAHEPEVAYLAELLLELDDQSPKPAGPVED